MWAPADVYTPFINAIGLALKQATTFVAGHLVLSTIAVLLVVVAIVLFSQLRGRDRG